MARRIGLTFLRCVLGAALVLAIPQTEIPFGAELMTVEDISGITRQGQSLLMVSDKDPGAYYRYPLGEGQGPAIAVDPRSVERLELPHAELALDLESIDVLGDGRLVVLSERLRALIGEEGVIAEYGTPLTEFGNRGLEGVAVLSLGAGHSRVAVLWEGGYPQYDSMPAELGRLIGRVPLRPVVWVHDMPQGAKGLRIRDDKKEQVRVQRIELGVPAVDDEPPPQGQRFRAPDLVWHTWMTTETEHLGFIVLLGSENSPPHGKRTFQHQWLLRFRMDGQPDGDPLDLNVLLPPELHGRNWEGLGWFDPGRSVVLIHDAPPAGMPTAYVLPLPRGW